MALQDKGFEVALEGIEAAAIEMKIYGPENTGTTYKPITWVSPTNASGSWQLFTNANSPVVFEITQSFLDNLPPSQSGVFLAQGVQIVDTNENIILEKAFASSFSFDVPGELTVEQVIIEAS